LEAESKQAISLPIFTPHVTLLSGLEPKLCDDTSSFNPSLPLPIDWLRSNLDLDGISGVQVRYKELDFGTLWNKKVFIRTEKDGIKHLATACQHQLGGPGKTRPPGVDVESWVENVWDPHISLV
jgi:hypothetical protein